MLLEPDGESPSNPTLAKWELADFGIERAISGDHDRVRHFL
jgi:hypothetical protein